MGTLNFSIIIPVYNVEKYIDKCIKSILNQSYTNFEVLLINDGSSDNSGVKCDYYSSIDNRIKTFHKSNKGVSAARNYGLKQASNEWIMFVDSDDWLHPNCLNKCVEILQRQKIDFLQFSFERVKNDSMTLHKNIETTPYLKSKDFIQNNLFFKSVWGSVFRKSIINTYHIQFNESMKLGEDQLFLFEYLIKCNTCLKTDDILYSYRYNQNSATQNAKTEDCINSIIIFQTHPIRNVFEKNTQENIKTFIYTIIKNKDYKSSRIYKLIKYEKFNLVRPQRLIDHIFLFTFRYSKIIAIRLLYLFRKKI